VRVASLGELGLVFTADVAREAAAWFEAAGVRWLDEQRRQALDRPQAIAPDVVEAWQ